MLCTTQKSFSAPSYPFSQILSRLVIIIAIVVFPMLMVEFLKISIKNGACRVHVHVVALCTMLHPLSGCFRGLAQCCHTSLFTCTL